MFESIREDFTRLVPTEATHAIPLSALDGDNVIGPSARTPWFEGQALLPYLETVEVERERASVRFGCPCSSWAGPITRSEAMRGRSCPAASRSATR